MYEGHKFTSQEYKKLERQCGAIHHHIAESCEFQDLKNGLIRADRIVIGKASYARALRERLLREADLTLEKA